MATPAGRRGGRIREGWAALPSETAAAPELRLARPDRVSGQGLSATVGLTRAQYQLLLAVKGHRGHRGPTVGDLAGYLVLKPQSTVELIDRAEAAGLVERWEDDNDRRLIRIRLTPGVQQRLDQPAIRAGRHEPTQDLSVTYQHHLGTSCRATIRTTAGRQGPRCRDSPRALVTKVVAQPAGSPGRFAGGAIDQV
jgi:DNA-binding MarR family transcriptional regulator